MDEERIHNNEPGSTSDEHNESYSAATLDYNFPYRPQEGMCLKKTNPLSFA